MGVRTLSVAYIAPPLQSRSNASWPIDVEQWHLTSFIRIDLFLYSFFLCRLQGSVITRSLDNLCKYSYKNHVQLSYLFFTQLQLLLQVNRFTEYCIRISWDFKIKGKIENKVEFWGTSTCIWPFTLPSRKCMSAACLDFMCASFFTHLNNALISLCYHISTLLIGWYFSTRSTAAVALSVKAFA